MGSWDVIKSTSLAVSNRFQKVRRCTSLEYSCFKGYLQALQPSAGPDKPTRGPTDPLFIRKNRTVRQKQPLKVVMGIFHHMLHVLQMMNQWSSGSWKQCVQLLVSNCDNLIGHKMILEYASCKFRAEIVKGLQTRFLHTRSKDCSCHLKAFITLVHVVLDVHPMIPNPFPILQMTTNYLSDGEHGALGPNPACEHTQCTLSPYNAALVLRGLSDTILAPCYAVLSDT